MSISNYQQLKDAILVWSHRDDIDLLIDDFIQLTETEFYSNNVAILNMRFQETSTTTTLLQDENSVALPDDYIQGRLLKLELEGRRDRLYYRAPEQIKFSDIAGKPVFYTVTDKIEFERFADQDYTIRQQYQRQIPALTSTADTNDILTKHPNVYLFGALHQVFIYAVDEAEAAKYQNKFYEAIRGANRKDWKGRYGPAPRMTIQGSTP